MTYVVIEDVSTSWHEYEAATAGLVDIVPRGLILHVAGPTDDGVRIVELWATEAAAQQFRRSRLGPALTALAAASRPRSVLRELHPVQVVLRPAAPDRPARPTRRGP